MKTDTLWSRINLKLALWKKENFLKMWNTDFLKCESGLNVEVGICKNVE